MKKTVRSTKRYHAHDEGNTAKVGDMVRIEECKPISKQKRWTILSEAK
jgi:small subunit ribosomal protein S17